MAAHQEIWSTLDLQFFWSQFLFEKFLLSLCHKCIIAIVSGPFIYITLCYVVLLMLKLTTCLGWNLFFFLIFIYMFLISLCKDGTVTFWNPDSGKDIASKKIDYSIEDIKEENPEVVSLHCNPDLFFNNCRVP